MCRSRLWLLYCVRTAIRSTPAFTRFDREKSISRYSPANGTAGLARSAVSGASRLPSPPASTIPITLASAMSFLHILGGGQRVTQVTCGEPNGVPAVDSGGPPSCGCRDLDVAAEGQDAGRRADVQPEGAGLVGPALRWRVPVLEGARRHADGRLRLGAGLGLHDGGTNQPPHRALHCAVGPAGVDLHDLTTPAATGVPDPDGDRRSAVAGRALAVGGQVVPGRVPE